MDDSTASPTPETSEPGRRPNYQGGVYARKDGRFDVQYTKRTARGNKRVRTTVRTEEEAWEMLHRALGSDGPDGRWFNPRRAKRPHLYFVQGTAGGPIKIGVAKDVGRRLRMMQMACPVPLRVLTIAKYAGLPRERELHRRFAGSRLHGEWFEESPELLSCIAGLKESGGS